MCLPPRGDEEAYDSSKRLAPRRRLLHQLPAIVDDDDDTPTVTFEEALEQVFLVPTTLSSIDSIEERNQLWYNREDIKEFRRQAASISQQLRDGLSITEYTRGLELRTSLHRQDRKQMIVKRILEAQEDDSAPEDLARIAQQHSIWSRKLALAQAHKDYYAAYHPNLTSVLPEMPALLDCHKDMATKKRSLLGGTMAQTGRRVRCRMF
ncbi:expressed unknown protein [Seminavis robusta]|uniref:Uncharacterized protein n=1 Tax=Seminavis robusta TaxID=568900 RepID=A0A9N8DPI0_9STRA|nr:expressed unknown protein [Seminavis robusta]|eukprot:Sro254_g100140.1 n/a (208) ;mRNA; f:28304-28927